MCIRDRLCNKDNDCKGYSYRPTMNTCEYYTVTQPCATNPVTCTPIGFSIADNIGKIFTEPEIDEKGCYIKEKRKSQRHIVIQIKRFIQLFLYIQILVFFIRVNIFFYIWWTIPKNHHPPQISQVRPLS